MSLDYYHKLIPIAKELRREATPQEKHLWYDFLAKYPMRFQRQKAIDQFIVDFYCHQARLVIELDGAPHFTREGHLRDEARTDRLEQYGLRVIRFTNREVDKNFGNVCRQIDAVVQEQLIWHRERK